MRVVVCAHIWEQVQLDELQQSHECSSAFLLKGLILSHLVEVFQIWKCHNQSRIFVCTNVPKRVIISSVQITELVCEENDSLIIEEVGLHTFCGQSDETFPLEIWIDKLFTVLTCIFEISQRPQIQIVTARCVVVFFLMLSSPFCPIQSMAPFMIHGCNCK